MELEFKWNGASTAPNFVWREAGASLARWSNVATLYRSANTGRWYVAFHWRFDDLIPPTAYIYRQRWDDLDKAKKAVERKALPLIGVLQIQGKWA